MKRIRTIFITGFLVTVPILATIDIARWFVNLLDGTARKYIPEGLLPFDFQGLGLVLALVLVFGIGALTANFVGSWFVDRFDSFVEKFPIVGGLYGSIKQFLETVLGDKQDKFNEAVLVKFPHEGVYSIGFRTGEPDDKLVEKKRKKLVNVFVPCTPNPTSGFYLLVPEDEITPLDMSVQQAFKILISMGVVSNDDDDDEQEAVKKKLKKKK